MNLFITLIACGVLRMLAAMKCRQFRYDHRPLTSAQMPAKDVLVEDILNRIHAGERFEARFDASFSTSPKTIATVKDLAIERDNRFTESVLLDRFHQLEELAVIHHRENTRKRVIRHFRHCSTS